ncbi:MAG TPA: putative PEP-binding protein, partial [Sphaerochaeta sp.]|nr:putative PEP-binding protein [Sphaerochaeta sp.]
MRIFTGIAAAEGMAKGKALVFRRTPQAAKKRNILSFGVKWELKKLARARATAKETIAAHLHEGMPEESAQILETHLLMLDDPEYISQIETFITEELASAEWAIESVSVAMANLLAESEDPLLSERADDIRDVSIALIEATRGRRRTLDLTLNEEVILVADTLLPSDLYALDMSKVIGISLDGGGRASHVAILVRAFQIPTVIATGSASESANDGDEVIVDGTAGEVYIRADYTASQLLDERYATWLAHEEALGQMVDLPTVMGDGHTVSLHANIQGVAELAGLSQSGANGIGLFRSEFLFMESATLPTEEQQYIAYRQAVEAMAPKPVTIRTLDVGGDKVIEGLGIDEKNPILGWRAVRFCLARKDIFSAQLRALLRASAHGKLRIMFPMISGVEELNAVLLLLESV